MATDATEHFLHSIEWHVVINKQHALPRKVALSISDDIEQWPGVENLSDLYCSVSPLLQSTCPGDVVLKPIFIPYAPRSNIHCIGLLHPRTINPSIIRRTQSKLLKPRRRGD